jgi:hypothetical protein
MVMATQRFILTGPHAGKTIHLGGYDFVDGVLTIIGGTADVENAARIVCRYYSALPEQEWKLQQELEAAKATKDEQPAPVEQPAPLVGEALGEALKELDLDLPTALGQLDPAVDAHWTSNNLPALDWLSEQTGKPVKRAEVEAIAPDYTRAKARAAKG